MAIDSYAGCTVIVLGCGLIAILGQLVLRRVVTRELLKESHEVGGYLLQVVGTLYAVLLGLVVVDSMSTFQKARDITEREANSLSDVFILSSRFPDPEKTQIQKMCFKYADLIVNTEWDQMVQRHYCPDARRLAVSITRAVLEIEPTTENQKAVYPELVADSNALWQSRRSRINMASNGLPGVEWLTLIVGGIITVFFTYFFGLENLKLQLIMTGMVAMLIALNLVLVLLFAYPFSGDLNISPEAFRLDRFIFENNITSVPGETH